MKKSTLFALWGVMFIVCAGLGFIPEPEGALGAMLTVLSVGFFLPPALLLYLSVREGDRHTVQLVRNLSALSLGATLVLLVANFSLALRSEALGTFLHYALTVVSTPMVLSGHWALSLFLSACLLMGSLKQLK